MTGMRCGSRHTCRTLRPKIRRLRSGGEYCNT